MKTVKLLALVLVATFAISAQAEVIQLRVNSNSDCEVGSSDVVLSDECDETVAHPEVPQIQPSTQYLSYNFGINWVNSRRMVRFDVQNLGATPLSHGQATISGIGYSAIHSCTGVVMPHQRCWIEITYWPYFEGVHYGRFALSFKEHSHIVISLWGEARRW